MLLIAFHRKILKPIHEDFYRYIDLSKTEVTTSSQVTKIPFETTRHQSRR